MRVGQDTANWTTERLAGYLAQQTGIQVSEETVRVYLHAHDDVCKRSTWTRSVQSRGEGRLRGKTRGSVEVLLAATTVPEPLPVYDLVEADLWEQLPANLADVLTLLPHADVYAATMRCRWLFIRPVSRVWSRKGRRGQRLVEAAFGSSESLRLWPRSDWRDGWFDGRVAAGRTADVFCQQVRSAWLVPNNEGEWLL